MCDFNAPESKPLPAKLPFAPHFLTPAGMLLPKHQQPPPMYGPRGSTVPPKFMPRMENASPRPTFAGRGRGRPQHNNSNYANRRPPRPRNWDLWCETCDRDFGSMEQLVSHKNEHQTCGIDGCKFVGHPLVVTKHIQMQHSTGLYEKIKKLDTPDEIAKWREERRKNYPTAANVELKAKIEEQQETRGEKLKDPKGRFGPGDRNRKTNDRNRNRKRRGAGHRNVDTDNVQIKEEQVAPVAEEEELFCQGMPMFRGTSGMDGFKVEPKKPVNPLASMLGMYGSDSDTEDGRNNFN